MWYGPQFVQRPRNVDSLIIVGEIEFHPATLYWEHQVLIEALENWIQSLEALCDDRNTTSS